MAKLFVIWVMVTGLACLNSGGEQSQPDANTTDARPPMCSAADPKEVVDQILFGACGGSGCHGQGTPAAGLVLFSNEDVDAMKGAPATECPDKTLITPGSPETSYLVEKLLPSPTCGAVMPPVGVATIAPDDVQCVRDWIAAMTE